MLSLLRGPGVMVVAMLAAASPAVSGHGPAARPATAAAFPAQVARTLGSVSCRSMSWCMAAGSSATHRPYSALWNGTSWTALSTPAPAKASNLASVSCASRDDCVAVGSAAHQFAFADIWNGRRWRAVMLGKTTLPLGVSCPTTSFCMAVGQVSLAGPAASRRAMAMTWNGSKWRALAMPSVPHAASSSLASVSCASASVCTAVGYHVAPGRTQQLTLAEQWNGATWQVTSFPAVPPGPGTNPGDVLSSVSCTAAGTCMAVGTVESIRAEVPDQAFAAAWDGHSWALAPGADPGGLGAGLIAVKCLAASCLAIGAFQGGDGGSGAIAESWDGHSWHQLATPGTSFLLDWPAAISCPSPAGCVTVGTGVSQAAETLLGFSAQWNGHEWQVRWVGKFASLDAVSCDPAIGCMAVGTYADASGRVRNLTELWNGRTWRQFRAPAPPPAPPSVEPETVTGVSCAGPAFCLAVAQAHSMTWNGRSWRARPIAGSDLTSVSCTSPDNCVAVGEPDLVNPGNVVGHWNGRTWHLIALHVGTDEFTRVTCRSSTWCMALGTGQHGLLAGIWNGRSPRAIATLPAPAHGVETPLYGISCTSRAHCMVVGSYTSLPSGELRDFADLWNGTRWRLLTVPGQGGLGNVSCETANSCLAAGEFPGSFSSPAAVNVTAQWNGRTWHRTRQARPVGLAAVSCLRITSCVAVGQATSVTLAELWDGTRWRHLAAINP